jgi:acyl carrier protein
MQTANRAEIMQTLTAIFRDVFDNPSLVLHNDLTAADVENWDSLNHIDLIVAVERKFNIKLTTREVSSLKNVGQLADLAEKKAAVAQ